MSDDEDGAVDWLKEGQTSGHAFISKRVAIQHDGELAKGTIVMWVPADEEAGNEALFHVKHDDGDSEDLDESEAEAAIVLLREAETSAKARGKRKAVASARTVAAPATAAEDVVEETGSRSWAEKDAMLRSAAVVIEDEAEEAVGRVAPPSKRAKVEKALERSQPASAVHPALAGLGELPPGVSPLEASAHLYAEDAIGALSGGGVRPLEVLPASAAGPSTEAPGVRLSRGRRVLLDEDDSLAD